MTRLLPIAAIILLVAVCAPPVQEEVPTSKLKALIIDGQNNHYVWPKTTMMMRDYLEQTGLFEVSIHRMDSVWLGIKYNKSRPEGIRLFHQYLSIEFNFLRQI